MSWLWAMPAYAVESEIGVVVCGGSVPAAQVAITEPVSDSIVTQATTTLRGTVANATQIEVAVDGDYSQTFSVGANDTSFETDLTLVEGTHTITMTAIGICGSQNATDEIVLTFQREAEPSAGATTPTEIDTGDGGVVIADGHIDDGHEKFGQAPLVGAVVNGIAGFTRVIGLENTVNTTNPLVGISRIGVTVVALVSVVMASSLAPIAAQFVPGVSELFNATNHRSMLYLGWVIRGVGVLALALAYFL